jgi:hypothetical protein
MLNYEEQIKELLEKLLGLEKRTSRGLERDRVRFLRFLKSGEARSQIKAGLLISLGNRQSQRLWSL